MQSIYWNLLKAETIMKKILSLCVLLSSISAVNVHAEEVDCVTTSWKLIGSNHKVCVQAYDDPKVKGVSCYMSQAKKAGLKALLV